MAYKTLPTREIINSFWTNNMFKNRKVYLDNSNELDMTLMAEEALEYFQLETPNGDSEIESKIFDWSVDYVDIVNTYPNLTNFLSSQING